MNTVNHIKEFFRFWKPSVARKITLYFAIFGKFSILWTQRPDRTILPCSQSNGLYSVQLETTL